MNDMFMMTTTTSSPLIGSDSLTEDIRKQHARNSVNSPYSGVKFDSVLQESDVFGNNKRLYTNRTLQEAMARFEPTIRRGHALMEDGHPVKPSSERFATVLRDESVVKILDYRFEDGFLKGKVETLNSHRGRDFRDMLLQGNYQGSSSLRALGRSRKTKNGAIVDGAIRIIGFDIVLNPSFEKAVFNTVLTESEVLDIIEVKSELFKASLDTSGFELSEATSVKLGENAKTAIVCDDRGQCLSVFLESHLSDLFTNELELL